MHFTLGVLSGLSRSLFTLTKVTALPDLIFWFLCNHTWQVQDRHCSTLTAAKKLTALASKKQDTESYNRDRRIRKPSSLGSTSLCGS